MKLVATPGSTVAILVGIECYAGADSWYVDGPACSAMRMAEWLFGVGVPAVNINLYVNFHPRPSPAGLAASQALRSKMHDYGIVLCEPNRSNLEKVLEPANLPAPVGGSGTLILYFCGHGVSSEVNMKRFALTSDAHDGAHHAIDIEYQCASLRLDPKASGYPTQWLIQDACAQTSNAEIRPRALNSVLPDEKLNIRQYAMYSTRPGEFSATNADAGATFTFHLLEVLKASGPLQNINLAHVYDQLAVRFEGSDQHPTVYRRDENWATHCLVPGMTLGDKSASGALVQALQKSSVSMQLMRAVFQQVAGTPAAASDSVQHLLRQLGCLVPAPHQALSAVERFGLSLESFCHRYAQQKARGTVEMDEYRKAAKLLSQWVNKWVKKRNGPAVLEARRALEAAAGAADEVCVVVLDVEGDGQCGSRAWRYLPDGNIEQKIFELNSTDLTPKIAEALQLLSDHQWLSDPTVIEILLPLQSVMSPLAGIVVVADAQHGIRYTLGDAQLPFVLRISERWTKPDWRERWKKHWSATAAWRDGIAMVAWMGSAAPPGPDGWYWIGVSDVASAHETEGLNKAVFQGAPFAAWCAVAHQQTVEATLTRHSYADRRHLLQKVSALNAAGQGLTCLVDDAERLPPGAVTTLKQPLRRPSP